MNDKIIGLIIIVILIVIISIATIATVLFSLLPSNNFNQKQEQDQIQRDNYNENKTKEGQLIDLENVVTTEPKTEHISDIIKISEELKTIFPLSNEFAINNDNDKGTGTIEALDILQFDKTHIYILNYDHTITTHYGVKLQSDIPLNKIFVFIGYIYAIGTDGELYTIIDNGQLWRCISCAEWCHIKNIKHQSTTLDDEYLWLQNDHEGILFDSEMNIVEHISIDLSKNYRIYGNGKDNYETIDAQKYGAAILNHNGKLYTCKNSHNIRLINWKPVYLI